MRALFSWQTEPLVGFKIALLLLICYDLLKTLRSPECCGYFIRSLISLGVYLTGQKLGGQELIGGLDCMVHRNFFGSQVVQNIFQFHTIMEWKSFTFTY